MNWLEHIKNKYIAGRVVALLLIITMLAGLSSCAFVDKIFGGETPSGEEPGDADESAHPGWVAEPPDISSDRPNGDTPPAPPEESETIEVEKPGVPLQTAAEDSFFEDAAFMGNSLMDGFRMFSGITTCDYYAVTSMTVSGVSSSYCIALDNGGTGTIVDGLTQKEYGKIYILLGINEIGMNLGAFIELYGEMLDAIIAGQPDCDIYIMGITPVSYAKSSSGETFSMTRIKDYNSALYELAGEKDCYYLDLVEALADDTGYLPAAETTDGVHFSAKIYQKWVDYVKTHYAA